MTIHDEEKMDELIDKYCIDVRRFVPSGVAESAISAMKEYAEHIRQKTIDECIACIPETALFEGMYAEFARRAYEMCQRDTITNLEQLKK